MFEPRVKNGQTDLLMKALLSLESTDEAYRFFEDLCTIAEIKSMAQRIEVAKMLREHATYQEIARQTGASSATIFCVERRNFPRFLPCFCPVHLGRNVL